MTFQNLGMLPYAMVTVKIRNEFKFNQINVHQMVIPCASSSLINTNTDQFTISKRLTIAKASFLSGP